MQELWYWMLIGILPYRFVWQIHTPYGWRVKVQAMAWYIRFMRQSPTRCQIQLHLPLLEKLRAACWLVVQRDSKKHTPDNSNSSAS